MELKRVVVTGLGALTPIGNNVPELWDALVAGKSGGGPITHFDATKFRCRIAAELKGPLQRNRNLFPQGRLHRRPYIGQS